MTDSVDIVGPGARREGETFSGWIRRRMSELGPRSPERIDRAVAPVFREAGVLAPLWEEGDGVRLALTLRSARLSAHQGQISFPGGSCEPGETSLDAALRETEEELGVDRRLVVPAGELDDVWSLHGYIVTPHVGWLSARPEWVPSPDEVERVIEVDVESLMRPEVHRVEHVGHGGVKYPIHYFDAEGDVIWGMTAGILHRFFSLLRGDESADEPAGTESLRRFLARRQA